MIVQSARHRAFSSIPSKYYAISMFSRLVDRTLFVSLVPACFGMWAPSASCQPGPVLSISSRSCAQKLLCCMLQCTSCRRSLRTPDSPDTTPNSRGKCSDGTQRRLQRQGKRSPDCLRIKWCSTPSCSSRRERSPSSRSIQHSLRDHPAVEICSADAMYSRNISATFPG